MSVEPRSNGALAEGKILYLESLRGIAALTVALHHFRVNTPIADNTFVNNGWLMVDFFFVLSGYVIALNYQEEIRSWRTLVTFQAKRFLRLYPLHIVMLFVFLGIETAKYFVTHHMGLVPDRSAFSANNAESFLHHISLTQSLFIDGTTWNGPSWSISAEFYTYILFALVVLVFKARPSIYIAVSSVLVALGFLYLSRNGYTFGIVRCLYSFFIGVLVLNCASVARWAVSTFAMTLVVGATVVGLSVSEWPAFELVSLMFPPIFGLMILALVRSPVNGSLKRILEHRSLVYLGTISYGIYMVHVAVWWVINQVLRQVVRLPTVPSEEGGLLVVMDNQIYASLVVIAGVAAILYLSHQSYRRIEMPLNALRHRLGRYI